ncbi:putative molybdenum carrier protein [Halomonas sp. HL-93]|uniref:putative molybdenum carrier protein n=1 Tax=Halomonas sp. HL-93 TaxID=1666906 RepID=UPI0006DA341E|nr:putative molybdenum carrier protein [Halomonas sp. HL-93]KPQ19675.1 MAG: putative molybdenum carrier [Halomonas sp. HL-93]SBR52017.1 Putative molybdenum carrier [Halomonas sp. HL-93]
MTLNQIISGGQTGVDRGALDAALSAGFPCGGWCSPGREAGDGVIPDRYPLTKMPHGGYRQRMIQNILDSDGTLVLYFGELEGGTEATLIQCIKKRRPYRLVDASEIAANRAAEIAARFIERHGIETLNVAGPSEPKAPRGHDFAQAVIGKLLGLMDWHPSLD